MKKMISTFLLILMVASTFAINASARTVFWPSRNYGSEYARCDLTKPGKKDGWVRVKYIGSTPAGITIQMRNKNGKVLWTQSRAMMYDSTTGDYGKSKTRYFYLGKNNSQYRLYFKSTAGCDHTVYVYPSKNVTVR